MARLADGDQSRHRNVHHVKAALRIKRGEDNLQSTTNPQVATHMGPVLLTAKRAGSEGCVVLRCACCVCVLLCALTYLLPSGPEVRFAWSCRVRVVCVSSGVP